MKSILSSFKPEECANILNHHQTIILSKTMPKCDLPIDVYIYCTKDKEKLYDDYPNVCHRYKCSSVYRLNNYLNGKVVAKFTLNKVEKIDVRLGHPKIYIGACVGDSWCLDNGYHDKEYNAYAWHIDNLVIFDEPKELSEFKHWVFYEKCEKCPYGKCDDDYSLCSQCCEIKPLTKAPQTWCYVEEE